MATAHILDVRRERLNSVDPPICVKSHPIRDNETVYTEISIPNEKTS